MRLLIQRVKEASVEVDGKRVGAINRGLLTFLGLHKEDSKEQIPWLVNKLATLRIFEDDAGKMNKSVKDIDGEILVVSQFTLYGNCMNGRRPDFIASMGGEEAKSLYDSFVEEVKRTMGSVESGIFGAYMQVHLINDGPATFMLEK